jgi:hypothetical protein
MWDSLPEIMPYESMRNGIILDYLGLEFSGLLRSQSTLGGLHQLPHKGFATAHGVDNAGTKHRSRSGRSGRHAGWREKSFQVQSYLTASLLL